MVRGTYLSISLAIVNAGLHGAVLLAYHHNIGALRRRGQLNDVMLEHVLHMFVNEGQLCGRMVPKLLKVWHNVAGVNAVRDNTQSHTTNDVL